MPIVEQPNPDSPLSQGDILTGIRFFSTENCWSEKGGDSVKAPFNLCMVLSRPCVAAYKDTFIVAAVEQFKQSAPRPTEPPSQTKGDLPKGAEGFDKLLSFLTGIRDGRTSPDVFYLGQLPRCTGRHAARFDSLHTLQTPRNPEEMTAFLKKCRIGSLNVDFCRDLHVRVFNAFASLGFDDHGWFSTEDLQAVVDQGRAELITLEAELAKKVAAQSGHAAEGKQISSKDIEATRTRVEEFRVKLAPYQQELEKRNR
jgi:hypothetical protein